MLDVVRRACEAAGGVQTLAERIGVKRQAFYQWPKVPADRVLPIERATGGAVKRHEMRPDLYPPEEAEEGADEESADAPRNGTHG